ncbi:hypothetical protein K443DRAFT_7267 [Laccaria amethystina LaAM-08-1]|uniref:Uncharacterized protein n=1 Tax=Laccaria amethystina LaAM-08-1 TaxID=1095629 RepID=A0A0C9X7M5_9AGAR|nr:hypothetical protein K443DRAFT_7267 [Laccaria amethystina LaAM-08-1]
MQIVEDNDYIVVSPHERVANEHRVVYQSPTCIHTTEIVNDNNNVVVFKSDTVSPAHHSLTLPHTLPSLTAHHSLLLHSLLTPSLPPSLPPSPLPLSLPPPSRHHSQQVYITYNI